MTASSPLQSDDLYERLGVSRTATPEEIKRAYQTLLRQYPPERAPEEFKRIREAYETLANPKTRAEYDRAAVTGIERILASATSAMRAADYATAERLFKQVLLEQPDLSYVRNLLGLCFLYQKKADEAIVQYARLTRDPTADPVWWANAGHAYRIARRYAEAERAFREAVSKGGDDLADHYAGWAEIYIDQQQYPKARAVLEKGIKADGKIDFEDVPLFLKLLEVSLFERNTSGIAQTLTRLTNVAQTEEQKRYVAWKLGALAWQLIRVEAFEHAQTVARAARRLQPEDLDYDALDEVSGALARNDHDSVLRLIRSHVSFAPTGWLEGLGRQILQYCQEHAVYNGMKPITGPPSLTTINTVGFKLYGKRDYDPQTNSYIATLYFVVLFLPLFPVSCYRVIAARNGWRFLGKVPFGRVQKLHLAAFLATLVIWIVSSSRPSASSSIETAYPTSTPAPTIASRPAAVYVGTVTNDGLPNSPASLRLALDSVSDTTTGYLSIGSPLEGSGPFIALATSESLYVVSGAANGDTIVWRGAWIGGGATGDYRVVRGLSRGQHGTWSVAHRSGPSWQN